MKIIKNRKKQLNLNTLKMGHIKKNYLNYLLNKNIEYKFKNALYIIYKFHSENKNILFIGTPLKFNKQLKELFKNTNHLFIPEKIWLNGLLTNTKPIFRFLFKKYLKINNKNNLKFLFNITRKKNLVVIINEYLNPISLKEFSKKQIPIISLNYISLIYNVKNNINNNEKFNNFFFLVLRNIFKNVEK